LNVFPRQDKKAANLNWKALSACALPKEVSTTHSGKTKKKKNDLFNGKTQYKINKRNVPALHTPKGIPRNSGKGELLLCSLAQKGCFSGLMAMLH